MSDNRYFNRLASQLLVANRAVNHRILRTLNRAGCSLNILVNGCGMNVVANVDCQLNILHNLVVGGVFGSEDNHAFVLANGKFGTVGGKCKAVAQLNISKFYVARLRCNGWQGVCWNGFVNLQSALNKTYSVVALILRSAWSDFVVTNILALSAADGVGDKAFALTVYKPCNSGCELWLRITVCFCLALGSNGYSGRVDCECLLRALVIEFFARDGNGVIASVDATFFGNSNYFIVVNHKIFVAFYRSVNYFI